MYWVQGWIGRESGSGGGETHHQRFLVSSRAGWLTPLSYADVFATSKLNFTIDDVTVHSFQGLMFGVVLGMAVATGGVLGVSAWAFSAGCVLFYMPFFLYSVLYNRRIVTVRI